MILVAAGNRFRRDDGVGPRLLDLFPTQERFHWPGDPLSLLSRLEGHEQAIMVDAVKGDTPGQIHRWTWDEIPKEKPEAVTSSHRGPVVETLKLAEASGKLPPHFLLYAVEASDYSWGEGLSASVEAALASLEKRIRQDIER